METEISRTTKILLLCGPLGSFSFIILSLIQGLVRENYFPLRFPMSSLAIGSEGFIQVANFIIAGVLTIIGAYAWKKTSISLKNYTWTPRLFTLVGIGLIGAGIFSTDPVYGYPITAPLATAQFTIPGKLHELFALIVFICLPLACFKFYKALKTTENKGLALFSLASGVGVLVAFFISLAGFKQVSALIEVAGLFQRLSIIIGACWITTITFYVLRTSKTQSIE